MKLLLLTITMIFCAASLPAAKAAKMNPGSGTRNSKTDRAQAKARQIKIDGAFGIKLGAPYSGATAPAAEGRLRVTPPAPAGFDVYYITLAADKTVASIRAEKKMHGYTERENEIKKIKQALVKKYGFEGNDFSRDGKCVVLKNEDDTFSITYTSTAPKASSGSIDAAGL